MDPIGTSSYSETTAELLEDSYADLGEGDTETNNFVFNTESDLVLALYSIICAVGIVGNLLVCIVLLRVPSLRSNTSHILVHLSLVDLVVCVLVIPYKILLPMSELPPPNPGFWGQLRCRIHFAQYPFWVCVLTSVFSLVTVHLERFVAIVYPHKYKIIFGNMRFKLLMFASCWVMAAITKSFTLFLFDEDEEDGCRFLKWPSPAIQAATAVCNFTINMFAPFVLMISMQLKVISKLKKQVRTLTGQIGSLQLNPADRRRMWQLQATQTLTRTLLAFTLTFAACWAPNQFMFLLYNFGVKYSSTSSVYHFGVILAVCNSCVNPIIYTMTNQPFRRGIRAAFRRGKRSARVDDGTMVASEMVTITARIEAN